MTSIVRDCRLIALLLVALSAAGCSTNPVTGRNELLLVSEAWELQVGEQQYAPLRQAQGGDYVVDPGVEEYVRQVGKRLALKSDRSLPYEFNVINDSTPNAWALPGGKISINRGLLVELENEAQLAAVLGHEIVHAAAKHGARGQTRGIGLQLAVLSATVLGAREGYGQLAQVGSSIGAQLINSKYGRDAELESDRFGMRYMRAAGYDPAGAVELQQTFVRLSEGGRQDFISGLFASHPPSEARVVANRRTAAQLPPGGDLGEARYRKRMARLLKSEPAYQRFEQAQAALAKGDTTTARRLTQAALKLEPGEAHFHSLLGDIASRGKDWQGAKRHLDRAIALNDSFFYYFLQRAKANEAIRDERAAAADYRRSLGLLPTSTAQEALGAMAARAGNAAQAQRYYSAAAGTDDAAGRRARQALQRLQPANTDVLRGVQVRKGVTQRGTLAFELINRTSRPVTGIELSIRMAPGRPVATQAIGGVLPPGQRRELDTGRKIAASEAARVAVRVSAARAATRP